MTVSDPAGPDPADQDEGTPRRRPTPAELERIFGTDPVSTRDDLPEPEVPAGRDSWYLDNRPPHHG